MALTCSSCGATAVSGQFCNACGQPLTPDGDSTRTSASPLPAQPAGYDGSDSFSHGRFAPGTSLGERYRIVGRLGAGGMGEVYRADDLTLGHAVALKFLPEAVERDPEKLEQLTAEIRTARQISHPNVCRVYDVGDTDGRRFLTMEFVDGEDLRSLLRRIGRLPEDKALEIARQICAGLAAIHDREVLHRDLKPANIMLDGRGKVRLTDFGLATAVAGAGADGEIAGTPAYMAPEQLHGESLTVATDLYALGLVLWEIFTGERLQTGESAGAIRDAQQNLVSTLTSNDSGAKLDPTVQRVIVRCLDPDPARRPQSATSIAAALPGGDPLAAALAAGETPSPQMVAAAGEDGGLSFKVAVPLLVTFVVSLIFAGWLQARDSPTSRISLPNSPDVLTSKAREILDHLGYGDEIGDSAFDFDRVASTNTYQRWLDEQEGGPEHWYDDVDVRPALWGFWYRTSPQGLLPQSERNPVSTSDPPLSVAGMTRLRLDPDGRLTAFDAVPPLWMAADTVAPEPDWRALFDKAGLDITAFVESAPEWVGASPSDVRRAWVGSGATTAGAELRVEAAAFGGRPVFFRLVAPWTTRPTGTTSASSRGSLAQSVTTALIRALLVGVPLAAIVIARHNLRRGRVDTRGATRIAVVIGVLAALESVLVKPVWQDFPFGVFDSAARPLLMALLGWCFYAAVEPAVRRAWPVMLTSWSRLMDGRWRDPLVGRDLLVGSTLCAGSLLASLTWDRLIESLGISALPVTSSAAVLSIGAVVETYVASAQGGLLIAFGFALMLVLARRVLRSEWRALVGTIALMCVPAMLANPEQAPSVFFIISLPLVAVTRWGLLSAWAFFFLGYNFVLVNLALPPFASSAMVVGLVLTLAPGVFGFHAATRGRASGAWLEE